MQREALRQDIPLASSYDLAQLYPFYDAYEGRKTSRNERSAKWNMSVTRMLPGENNWEACITFLDANEIK